MNAEVRIHIEQQPEALQVPVQALAQHKGHFFALVRSGMKYDTREVQVSSANDKVATIPGGLVTGDIVVISPRRAGGRLVLPDMADPPNVRLANSAPSETKVDKQSPKEGHAEAAGQ